MCPDLCPLPSLSAAPAASPGPLRTEAKAQEPRWTAQGAAQRTEPKSHSQVTTEPPIPRQDFCERKEKSLRSRRREESAGERKRKREAVHWQEASEVISADRRRRPRGGGSRAWEGTVAPGGVRAGGDIAGRRGGAGPGARPDPGPVRVCWARPPRGPRSPSAGRHRPRRPGGAPGPRAGALQLLRPPAGSQGVAGAFGAPGDRLGPWGRLFSPTSGRSRSFLCALTWAPLAPLLPNSRSQSSRKVFVGFCFKIKKKKKKSWKEGKRGKRKERESLPTSLRATSVITEQEVFAATPGAQAHPPLLQLEARAWGAVPGASAGERK